MQMRSILFLKKYYDKFRDMILKTLAALIFVDKCTWSPKYVRDGCKIPSSRSGPSGYVVSHVSKTRDLSRFFHRDVKFIRIFSTSAKSGKIYPVAGSF